MRKNMKAERVRKGLTIKEAAATIGVSTNTYNRWELGYTEPSATHIITLSKLYGCTPEYLLGIVDVPSHQAIIA